MQVGGDRIKNERRAEGGGARHNIDVNSAARGLRGPSSADGAAAGRRCGGRPPLRPSPGSCGRAGIEPNRLANVVVAGRRRNSSSSTIKGHPVRSADAKLAADFGRDRYPAHACHSLHNLTFRRTPVNEGENVQNCNMRWKYLDIRESCRYRYWNRNMAII